MKIFAKVRHFIKIHIMWIEKIHIYRIIHILKYADLYTFYYLCAEFYEKKRFSMVHREPHFGYNRQKSDCKPYSNVHGCLALRC